MLKYELLYQSLCQYSPIPLEEWENFAKHLEDQSLSKGDYFLRAGEQAKKAAFIISGFTRMFYITDDGQEFNHVFMFENMIMAGYPSLLSKTPSLYYIQAMEDCQFLTLDYSIFEEYFDRHQCWDRLGRKIAEYNYMDKIQREYSLLLEDATTRYKRALEQYPGIEKRVPQYHLASFLGITASALNRIIKKIKANAND